MNHRLNHANQLTLRGLDPRVLAEVQRVARAHGVSLNKAALSILMRGAGLEEPPDNARRIGKAVDRFIGSWAASQARQFARSTRSLEQVDEKLWK